MPASAQVDCAEGTLWEPYTMVCAEVRDVRDQFLPPSSGPLGNEPPSKIGLQAEDLPVPGGLAVGITYRELPAINSGRLHTKMFVHPDGLQPDADLPILMTTATSHMHHGLELAGIYSRENPSLGQLGLFAWPCQPDYPCPDGDTSPGWQWTVGLPELVCNITHGVDQGGHAQKLLYYANHTDKLDEGTPPLWKSAVYLWNYCAEAWDLSWELTYREDKVDCSAPGSGCAWWGPGLEIFGSDPYPQIAELGYEDSLLYHDGAWSELRWPEAGFRDPAVWAPSTPWQLFHLDPNRSFGVGNYVDINAAPVINGQEPLEILEDDVLTLGTDSLLITDPDVDPNFHVEFVLTLHAGDNYSRNDQQVVPDADFTGYIVVPISVSDGAADSPVFDVHIEVIPVNDPPVITGQIPLELLAGTSLTITLDHLRITDPDNEPGELSLSVQEGSGYVLTGNSITPIAGVLGEINVSVVVSDGDLNSVPYDLRVLVKAQQRPRSHRGGSGTISPLLLLLLLVIWTPKNRRAGSSYL